MPRLFCSKHAQTPINTELEMTFADDYKPSFERLSPAAAQVPLQEPAQQESLTDRYKSGMRTLQRLYAMPGMYEMLTIAGLAISLVAYKPHGGL